VTPTFNEGELPMILAACLYALIAAFALFLVWAIAKVIRSLASIADSLQKLARILDRRHPPS
jgi:hypothetical protein